MISALKCSDFLNTFGVSNGINGSQFGNDAIATVIFNTDSNNLPYCAFIVNESCDSLIFSDGYSIFVDKNNIF